MIGNPAACWAGGEVCYLMSVQIANVRMVVSTSPSHEPLARLAAPTSMGSTELVLHQLLPQQPIIYYIIKGLVFWR